MKEEIEKAAEIVKSGGVILYPTDTIWGLGCNLTNDNAVKRILEMTNSAAGKGLNVLVPNEAILQRYVKEIPEVCYDLLDYADQPLTIVYPTAQHLSLLIPANDGSVAVRLTKDKFCVQLMQKLKAGILSVAASESGDTAPLSFQEIDSKIKAAVDYVVDLPNYRGSGKVSQIIKISSNNEVRIIRK